ncbi:hypothetical protein M3Y96_00186600 [Aphelenchoides besseyi]|nr:hypothetical protein M3Y96_00186600 [Aphelenchoides besseyi]
MMMFTFVLINEFIAVSLSLMFNLTLLILLNRHTPSHLKSYARMLYIHCFSDMFYELISVLTSVSPTPINGTVFLVLTGFWRNLNIYFTSYLLRLYFCSILYSILLLTVDFWYRYCTVWYSLFGPSDETHLLEQKLRVHFQWQNASFSTFEPSNPYAIQCLVFLITLVVLVYLIMFFTIYKINSKIKSGIPRRFQTGHRQVLRILFLQTTVPLVLCVPSVLVCLCALLAIDLPNIGPLILSVTVWLGVVKPLITICIVPAFRRRLFILANWFSSDDS